MNDFPPILAKNAHPGDPVRGSRIRHCRITADNYYKELRIVLEDLRTATMGGHALIQHSDMLWQGYLMAPENAWDIANSEPRPDKCPGCRLDSNREGNWIFREGGMRTSSPCGGINISTYYAGVWECMNCAWQPLPKPVMDHPSNT